MGTKESPKKQDKEVTEELLKKDTPSTAAEKRSNIITIVTAVVAVLAFAIVLVVIFMPKGSPGNSGNVPEASYFDGPVNMPEDHITIGANGAAELSDSFTPQGTTFEARDFVAREDGKIVITMYFDPQCPACKAFEETNSGTIDTLLKNNQAVLELHPIAFLDSKSTTNYATRASNALACVAETSPNSFYDFFLSLYENQPAEGSSGLTDAKLIELASGAGATNIADCINTQKYRPWVTEATQRAINGPLVGTYSTGGVEKTPYVFINGRLFDGDIRDGDEFLTAVQEAR